MRIMYLQLVRHAYARIVPKCTKGEEGKGLCFQEERIFIRENT
jgi:hypothetical protein